MIKKEIPENVDDRTFKLLEELWNEVYKERRQKVGRKRAIISANARVYARLAERFNRKPSKIEKSSPRIFITEEKKYNDYEVDGLRVITTTDPKVLNDFPNPERKGQFKKMDDAFEREIVSKLLSKYEAPIHPEMYYVIVGDR